MEEARLLMAQGKAKEAEAAIERVNGAEVGETGRFLVVAAREHHRASEF